VLLRRIIYSYTSSLIKSMRLHMVFEFFMLIKTSFWPISFPTPAHKSSFYFVRSSSKPLPLIKRVTIWYRFSTRWPPLTRWHTSLLLSRVLIVKLEEMLLSQWKSISMMTSLSTALSAIITLHLLIMISILYSLKMVILRWIVRLSS